jgi:hypothetical protein
MLTRIEPWDDTDFRSWDRKIKPFYRSGPSWAIGTRYSASPQILKIPLAKGTVQGNWLRSLEGSTPRAPVPNSFSSSLKQCSFWPCYAPRLRDWSDRVAWIHGELCLWNSLPQPCLREMTGVRNAQKRYKSPPVWFLVAVVCFCPFVVVLVTHGNTHSCPCCGFPHTVLQWSWWTGLTRSLTKYFKL